jgi:hypothetical protein
VQQNHKVSGSARRGGLVRAGGVAAALVATLGFSLGAVAGASSAAAYSGPVSASVSARPFSGGGAQPMNVRWQ